MTSSLRTSLQSKPSARGFTQLGFLPTESVYQQTSNGYSSIPKLEKPKNSLIQDTTYMNIVRAVSSMSLATSKFPIGFDELRRWGALTHGIRYHVPAHVQEHVDYITPGIKLSAVSGKPGRAAGRDDPKDVRKLSKRTFGVGERPGNGPIRPSPPIKAPLPMPFNELLTLAEGSLCNAAITPECIRREW